MSDSVRVRPDVRLDDGPMIPLGCGQCGAIVEVRKSSWDQTSIQWHRESAMRCVERRASTADDRVGAPSFMGCSALRTAIREAAVRGEVPIVDESEARVNEAAGQGQGHH